MRLQLSEHRHHTEVVTAACWTPSNELYTCSDDQTICKWGLDGELQGEVCKLDTYVTGMFWFQPMGKQDADTFVVCCSDQIIAVPASCDVVRQALKDVHCIDDL